MTIRAKTLAIVWVTIALLIAVMVVGARVVLLEGTQAQERAAMQEAAGRAQSALSDEASALDERLAGLGHTDEAAAFVAGEAPDFAALRLGKAGLRELGVDFLAVLDAEGRVRSEATALDGRGGRPRLGVGADALAKQGSALRDLPTSDSRRSGMMATKAGPMLLASRPIVARTGRKTVRGAVIGGRLLDADAMRRIETRYRLPMQLYALGGKVPADVAAAMAAGIATGAVVRTINDRTIVGYTFVSDLTGTPAFVLRQERPREFYARGVEMLWNLVFIGLVVGLVAGVAAMVITHRSVFRRIGTFAQDVVSVGTAGDLKARVKPGGGDELAAVADAVNGMLAALEVSQAELREKEALAQSEERYRGLVELSPDAVIIISDGRCAFANESAVRLLAASRSQDLLTMPVADIFHPEEGHRLRELEEVLNGGVAVARLETRFRRLNGSEVDVEVALTPFTLEGREARQLVARDITERRITAERIHHLAYHDALTGLPNRLLFKDRLLQAIHRANRGATKMVVGVLDLDRFKEVNDTLGHDVGDRLLQQVAQRVQRALRTSDTVARVGGDEFFLVFPEVADAGAAEIAVNRVHDQFSKPFVVDAHELFITPSIGASVYPDDGTTIDDLVKNADVAMYRAKTQGRNGFQFYSAEMSETVAARHTLETDLHRGLERNELALYLQPQVNLRTGLVAGFEALVRWQNPERGLVLPGEFIPVAEEVGLVEAIDQWVLTAACQQLGAWLREGLPPTRLAVNLSARQFRRHDLRDVVQDILGRTGVAPELLEIEITESIAMENPERALLTLQSLQELGVTLALDDFGSGYSSFGYLRRFPVKTLKIDRLFVQNMAIAPRDVALVQAMVTMSRALDLRALAEAVETPEQATRLWALGCHEAQGYFFGRPMTPADARLLLVTPPAFLETYRSGARQVCPPEDG